MSIFSVIVRYIKKEITFHTHAKVVGTMRQIDALNL